MYESECAHIIFGHVIFFIASARTDVHCITNLDEIRASEKCMHIYNTYT